MNNLTQHVQEIKKDMYNFKLSDWIVFTWYLSVTYNDGEEEKREAEGAVLADSYSPHTTARA